MIRGVNDKESGIQRHDSRLFGADCGDWRQDRIPELECDEGGRGAEDRRTRTRLCNAAEDGQAALRLGTVVPVRPTSPGVSQSRGLPESNLTYGAAG
jgi:hypothetical protein